MTICIAVLSIINFDHANDYDRKLTNGFKWNQINLDLFFYKRVFYITMKDNKEGQHKSQRTHVKNNKIKIIFQSFNWTVVVTKQESFVLWPLFYN